MNLTLTQPKRHSSSGSTCKEEKEDPNPITLQQGLFIASKLISMTSVGENWGSDFTRAVIQSMNEKNKDIDIISVLPKITHTTKTVIPSLRNIGAASVGGLSNLTRYSRHEQVDHIANDFDDDDDFGEDRLNSNSKLKFK